MLQVPTSPVPDWLPLQRLFLVGAIVLSLAVARRLTRTDERIGDVLRRRFVLGVPWGTLLTVLGVLSVYWFVQGGWTQPRDPLTIPFYSWSYFYPLGTVTAPFAHDGLSHVTGNLRATIVFAPIVEFAVGHYPRERGSQTFASLRTNPFARVLAVPLGSLAVGIFTGVFSVGPVIGFSGVVYAYMGFAVVSRPLVAVLGLVGSGAVDLAYQAVRNPQVSREPSPGIFSPGWADVAIQGHAIGILLGVLLALLLVRRRGDRPNPFYLWFAALVFGIQQSLWALYTPVGANEYVLFRAVGVGLVFGFAALVASAVLASDRSILPTLTVDVSRRRTATLALVFLLVGASAAAIPFGLTTIAGDLPEDAETVEIRDYTVTYVEDVPNQYVSFFDDWLFGESEQIRSSGVVVFSEKRHVWIERVSKSSLAFSGWASVDVGGLGWERSVYANRRGWSLVGNDSEAYKVTLREEGGQQRLAYATGPVRAEPTVDGRNVSVEPAARGFDVVVARGNESVGRATIPDPSNQTRVAGLAFERSGRKLFAVSGDTRVRVAQKSRSRAAEARQRLQEGD